MLISEQILQQLLLQIPKKNHLNLLIMEFMQLHFVIILNILILINLIDSLHCNLYILFYLHYIKNNFQLCIRLIFQCTISHLKIIHNQIHKAHISHLYILCNVHHIKCKHHLNNIHYYKQCKQSNQYSQNNQMDMIHMHYY